MPNRLVHEKSPYLLQHAHNPVQWYPWGEEAFAAAQREHKPIFLSVGYATCHWCHVMEKESFEDPEAAEALNRSFISIKVDREERPDIDTVYMAACQLMTGSGGWPMTIVMTPDKKPFFAGTYIPKQSAAGRPGLIDLCDKIRELWQQSPERVTESAQTVAGHMQELFKFESDPESPRIDILDQVTGSISRRFDAEYGGFDQAPKFPMAHRLLFLLQSYQRSGDQRLLEKTTQTLEAMRRGGLWDHVGFGFHRYATDRQWLLPHFEKMLYDQALLAIAYLRAYGITRQPLFEKTAREIFSYVQRDMRDPQGGFYTAEDADSEGEEGKYYVWTQAGFEALLDGAAEGIPWQRIFNLRAEGNFLEEASRRRTGANVLHLTQSWESWAGQLSLSPQELAERWEALRRRLFAERVRRPHPLKDDKILCDWNGLMIAALARGAIDLHEHAYLQTAEAAAGFIFSHLLDNRSRLLHRFRQGEAGITATANDYAFLIMGLIELHRAGSDPQWLERALALQQMMNSDFRDPVRGGFFLTAVEQRELPVRPMELHDGALPSANAVALHNLIHLHRLSGQDQWRDQAMRLMQAFGGSVSRHPEAFLHTLNGWGLSLADNA